jgi:glycosyltransferase involved in cell wall biosynthesis
MRYTPGRKEALILGLGPMDDEAKNGAALARVAARLSWPVYIAGGDGRPGAAGEFAGVEQLGHLDAGALAGWVGRAAIYAQPARYAPSGLLGIEAALAGCALVLGDIPSLREVWTGAALFVAPDDPDALARALQQLIDDEALRAEYARRARSRARQYTPVEMGAGYWVAYCDLVTAIRRPRRPAAMEDLLAGAFGS